MQRNNQTDLEKHRGLFLMIGFFMALLMVWFVMEWSTIDQPQKKNVVAIEMELQEVSFLQRTVANENRKPAQNSVQPKTDDTLLPQQAAHMPSFPGGTVALKNFTENKLCYPTHAKQRGIKGTVLVNFNVDSTGRVVRPHVVRSIHPLLDREAIRLVKSMPNWIPAKHQSAALTICLPVCFF